MNITVLILMVVITDIMGAPGTAKSALTVAASQSGKALQDAVEVTAGPA